MTLYSFGLLISYRLIDDILLIRIPRCSSVLLNVDDSSAAHPGSAAAPAPPSAVLMRADTGRRRGGRERRCRRVDDDGAGAGHAHQAGPSSRLINADDVHLFIDIVL